MRYASLRRAATFCAVVRNGTITAAATELGLSPAAVHHEIKLYATELGHPLFVKRGRRLSATPSALQLYTSLREHFSGLDADASQFRTELAEQPLRIASVTGFGRYRLAPALFRALRRDQPIRLFFDTQDQAIRALTLGHVELAVTYKPVISVPLLEFPLAEEELVLIAHPELCSQAEDELLKCPFVTYDEYEYVFARWFSEQMGAHPARLNVVDHSSELEEAVLAAAAARGCTIVPADAWGAIDRGGICRVIAPTDHRVTNQIYAVVNSGSQGSGLTQVRQALAVSQSQTVGAAAPECD